jgi:beta-lactamase class A
MTTQSLLGTTILALTLSASLPLAPAVAQASSGADTEIAPLEREFARIAGELDGIVGVAVADLSGGARFGFNANEAFPMASTFKIAVAGTILHRVETGELTLDRMVEVPHDRYVMSDIIASRLIHPGVSLSVANLMELMLTQSDNTATDMLTELAGGPSAVTAWLRSIGVEGQRVDRDTTGIIRDFFRLPDGPLNEAAAAAREEDPHVFETSRTAREDFFTDPRDTSSPAAMLDLLTVIARGEALDAERTQFLLDVMSRCRTGEHRLRGLLPDDVDIAHKTGTIGGTVNDVGLITLPDGREIAIAVFVKASDDPVEDRERTIAEIARLTYDYFLTAP